MQIRHHTRRKRIIFNISLIFLFFTAELQAYPGCCYTSQMYHKEWKAIGKYMKKYYVDAATLTNKAEEELTNAVTYMLFRSTNIISSMGYAYVFDASDKVQKDIYKEYTALYMTETGPVIFNAVLEGRNPLDVMLHPPRIEKSLMDFVVRTYNGAENHGVLYGNEHLSKKEIVFVRKEIQQECVNNDLEIKKLEADVLMLELELAKLSVLSNKVIADEKAKKIKE